MLAEMLGMTRAELIDRMSYAEYLLWLSELQHRAWLRDQDSDGGDNPWS